MRHIVFFASVASLVLLSAGCADNQSATGPVESASLTKPSGEVLGGVRDNPARNFRAHLAGREEVPPVPTRAQGQAIFQLSADGTSLNYKLIVANIEDVLQSHIHLAPAGANGSVVCFLYPSGPPPILIEGRFSGVLAEGTITASNLIGPLAGEPLSALVDAMEGGNTYVNVHTVLNPSGEIRGQIH